jgi:predicted PolB exonuclease-like 3'-5' exonuclease
MGEASVMVWDLETVPDLRAAARILGIEFESAEQVEAAIGTGFPKHPLHSIACIGALVARREDEGWRTTALGAPNVQERPEAELIRSFVGRIAELNPQLVTFNGNGFDLPVLRHRAMLHRVPASGLFRRPYFSRFSTDALDLYDVLGSFGASSRMKLDELSRFLGLAGKPDGIDGSKVSALIAEGRIADVSRYCETDVVNTYRLWLIYEEFRGALSREELTWSENQLQSYVRQSKTDNPYLLASVSLIGTDRCGYGA